MPRVPTLQALQRELFQPQLAGSMLAVHLAAGAVPTTGSDPLLCALNCEGSTSLTSPLANLAFAATQPPPLSASMPNGSTFVASMLALRLCIYCEGSTSLASALAFTATPPRFMRTNTQWVLKY